MIDDKRIGLALSGGGYRAAAFHLGVLRKLNSLQLLDKVDVISTISGGSIAGAYYALHKDDFKFFEESFKRKLQKSARMRILLNWRFLLPIGIVVYLILGPFFEPFNLERSWINIAIVLMLVIVIIIVFVAFFQFKIVSLTKLKIRAYKKIFFGNKVFLNLPDSPILAINASNLSTGTIFTFSKKKCADSTYKFPKDGSEPVDFTCSCLSIAIAVGASTCVPIPFDPVHLDKACFKNSNDANRVKPQLMDGGLYDNQGIHKLTEQNSSYVCDVIIVSDGSQPFSNKFRPFNSLFILYRGIDVMMRKVKNLQFIRDVYSAKKEIAYFSLDWNYQRSITEFINAAKINKITSSVLLWHGLDPITLKKPMVELASIISKKIDFIAIVKNAVEEKDIEKISRIKTDLAALRIKQINLLARHAEVLTELHIRLYCPTLAR